MGHFKEGNIADVTKGIKRVDGKNSVKIGESVKIIRVFNGTYKGEKYQVVDIQPFKGGAPICDIVCDRKDVPLKKRRL